MAKKVKPTKLVILPQAGSYKELGGISGPIINPCRLDIDTLIALIHGHKKVYEVNPENLNEKVLLTLRNVKLVNFKQKDKVVEEVKVETKSTTYVPTAKVTEKKEEVAEEEVITPSVEVKKEVAKSDFTKK